GLVIGAIENNADLHLNALNVPNDGCLPQLPEGAIVEVPAEVKNGCIQPAKKIYLPDKTVEICLNQCSVAGMIAKAAVEGNSALAYEIIGIDEAITHKKEAMRALKKMLKAHADILPQF
ncbi:MAG: hypothetical protein FWD71_18020, partial [Oscillospiraceae bacterium]|nr:hypothetical protein [Oscillospiraceae bacterium]